MNELMIRYKMSVWYGPSWQCWYAHTEGGPTGSGMTPAEAVDKGIYGYVATRLGQAERRAHVVLRCPEDCSWTWYLDDPRCGIALHRHMLAWHFGVMMNEIQRGEEEIDSESI